MYEEGLTEQQIKNRYKLIKAHNMNVKISDMNLKDKFTNFESAKEDEARTLLYEVTKNKKTYKRYSRGQIVKIKFGVNVGSEFSGDHFAIIISKGDSMLNPVLHVVPLTSKQHKKGLNVGNILYNEKYIKELTRLKKASEIKKAKKIINYYSKRKNTISYAAIDHIKTVSKLSIMKEINEYDFISKIKCSKEIMDNIDIAIINEYTINN